LLSHLFLLAGQEVFLRTAAAEVFLPEDPVFANFEARNPKFETNPNDRISNDRNGGIADFIRFVGFFVSVI